MCGICSRRARSRSSLPSGPCATPGQLQTPGAHVARQWPRRAAATADRRPRDRGAPASRARRDPRATSRCPLSVMRRVPQHRRPAAARAERTTRSARAGRPSARPAHVPPPLPRLHAPHVTTPSAPLAARRLDAPSRHPPPRRRRFARPRAGCPWAAPWPPSRSPRCRRSRPPPSAPRSRGRRRRAAAAVHRRPHPDRPAPARRPAPPRCARCRPAPARARAALVARPRRPRRPRRRPDHGHAARGRPPRRRAHGPAGRRPGRRRAAATSAPTPPRSASARPTSPRCASRAATTVGGVTYLRWRQEAGGVPLLDNDLRVSVDARRPRRRARRRPARRARHDPAHPGAVGDATRAPPSRSDAGVDHAATVTSGPSGPRRETTFSTGDRAALVLFGGTRRRAPGLGGASTRRGGRLVRRASSTPRPARSCAARTWPRAPTASSSTTTRAPPTGGAQTHRAARRLPHGPGDGDDARRPERPRLERPRRRRPSTRRPAADPGEDVAPGATRSRASTASNDARRVRRHAPVLVGRRRRRAAGRRTASRTRCRSSGPSTASTTTSPPRRSASTRRPGTSRARDALVAQTDDGATTERRRARTPSTSTTRTWSRCPTASRR